MNVSREEKKTEAIKRMEKMGYWACAKEAFRRQSRVFVNEPPLGIVYDPEPDLVERIKEFESTYNALVYMVVRSYMSFGECDSLLHISDHPEEWEMENEYIKNNILMTYTINKDEPSSSEFGRIWYRLGLGGGIVRVA